MSTAMIHHWLFSKHGGTRRSIPAVVLFGLFGVSLGGHPWSSALASEATPRPQAKAVPAPTSKGASKGPAKGKTRAPEPVPSKKAGPTVPVPQGRSARKPAKKPVEETREITTAAFAGKRDPFKSLTSAGPSAPIVQEMSGPLPAGLRGLVVGQLLLEGIVHQKTANTMIAVVTNESKRAYFLRENDTLYNGAVSKITLDAVYFKENYIDPSSGQVNSREVVKRMAPAPGGVK